MAKDYAKIDPKVIGQVGKDEVRRELMRKSGTTKAFNKGKRVGSNKPDSN